MATGPEHYREAERLLRGIALGDETYREYIDAEAVPHALVALGHVGLAIAAAIALNRTEGQPSRDAQVRDAQAWFEAAGTKKQPKDGAP